MHHTRKQIHISQSLLAITFIALLCASGGANGANFTTTTVQASGAAWTAAIWQGTAPTAGNTYQEIANGTAFGNNQGNTRIRNPAAAGVQTFPGDSLTMDANTEIRPKAVGAILNFPGVGGNPGLILNGGALGAGDTTVFEWRGLINVVSDSLLSPGDNGAGAIIDGRGMKFVAALAGSGSLIVIQGPINVASVEVTSANNLYSGTWIVKAGYLKGSAAGSLGTGNIRIDPAYAVSGTLVNPATALAAGPARFEVMYDIGSTGSLTLANGGIMILHQSCSFSAVSINGTALTPGAHSYAELSANFPANFAAGGSGQITVVPPGPPLTPANVTAVGGNAQVTLGWSLAANAAGYLIKRSDVDGGPYTTIGSASGTNLVDGGLNNGSLYYYVVAATNGNGSSADSAQVTGAPNVVVGGIVATGGTNQVTLGWDVLPGAASYTVLRSSTPSGFAPVASGLAGNSHVDTGVQSGRTYYYKVSASLTGGSTSAPSATVSGTTAPGAPALTATLFASTVVRVGWTVDPVVTQFLLESASDGVTFTPLATLGGTVSSYTNTGVPLGSTNSYRVRAVNATGPSDYSNVRAVTTPTGGFNVNFGAGGDNSANAGRISPIPPGYLNDIGDIYGDRTNGNFYGWTTSGGTNIVRDTRWRQNPISPDLRYDTLAHLMKANVSNPAQGATWEIQVPNGFYQVHIVAGDPDNADPAADRFQFLVEGVLTSPYSPAATPPIAHWADFTVGCAVNDGRLTISSGPSALNNKISFIDIYPDIPVAPVIGTQPQPVNVEEYRPATFTVGLSAGSTPLAYQWYLGNNPVTGGTNQTLTLAHARMADVGNYSVIVTNFGGSATSSVAALTVFADVTAPVVASVGSLDGLTIGLCFSEEMDNANLAIGDSFSYTINGDPQLSPETVTIRPGGRMVALRMNTPISGPFTVECVGAMFDLAGNQMVAAGNHAAGVVGGFTVGDVGSPTIGGSHYTCDGTTIDMTGGGADYWGMSDQAYLATKPVTGDFEAIVRVSALAGANAIAKGVLVARETLSADSRGYHLSVNPTPPGRDQVEMGMRNAAAAATVGVGSSYIPAGVPNAWLRLTRVGNTFTGYRSTNGLNWVPLGTNVAAPAYPASMMVGLAVTAHDNALSAAGTFSNLQILGLVGSQFASGVYNAGMFTAGFATRPGFTYIVEYKDAVTAVSWTTLGNPIAGDGTVKTFTDPGPVSPTSHRIYRVSYH